MNTSVDDLWQLIKGGRSALADWFNDQTPVFDMAAAIAAMSNTLGGLLLLGVDPRLARVTGVSDTAEAVDRLLQAALMLDPPLILPMPKEVRLDGKMIVYVSVPRGMPHVYALEGRYLRRREHENVPLKSRELRALIMERTENGFENEVTVGAALDDLDWEKAKAYAANLSGIGGSNAEKVLLKRGCLVETGDGLRPTNAGMLLFGKDPQRWLRGADITAARFAGETMSDIFTRQDILGPLPDQIRRAEMFLVDHLRKGVQIKQTMARSESYEYPLEAARELVVNAVAHRDYRITGDGIRLFLFSNRMEVTSPGALPGPVTVANIKDERFSRNPVIVQVLSDLGYIERLGYGVDRVIDLMRQQNLSEPEFQEKAGGFRVVLYNEVQPQTPLVPEVAPSLSGVYRGIEVNIRQETALIYLQREGSNYRITNSDFQQLCPGVHPETIRRDLADLVAKNILRKMGQKRGSYYVLNRDDL